MTKNISAQDKELFRSYVKDVKPISSDKIILKQTPPKIRKKEQIFPAINDFPNLDDYCIPVAGEETLFFARSGIQTKLLNKLRRGQLAIEAQLDLHGYTVTQAKQELLEFLQDCYDQNLRIACIIHGKGLRAKEQQALLKSMVNSWLQQHSEVLAFCSTKPKDGGTGAVYVLLKKNKKGE